MDLSASTGWWIVGGVLLAIEMTTGTFYLLMLAIGAVGAALAAHMGLGLSAQLIMAAVLGGGAVVAWHLRRKTPTSKVDVPLHLDIGERVMVDQWRSDGTASVSYRGAQWSARYAGADVPQSGEHVIRGVEGSRLLLAR